MKLYIDDIRDVPDESWTLARTIESAITFIATMGVQIDEISIDHDISIQVEVLGLSRPYPCPDTFAAVAYFIGEYYRHVDRGMRPAITIHTASPVGGERLMRIFADYGMSSTFIQGKPASRKKI